MVKNVHLGHHRAVIDKIIGRGFASFKNAPKTYCWLGFENSIRLSGRYPQADSARLGPRWITLSYEAQTTTTEAECEVAVSVIASLQYLYVYVKQIHKGRHENMVRAAHYVISMAVSLVPPLRSLEPPSLSSISQLLGAPLNQLSEERKTWEKYVDSGVLTLIIREKLQYDKISYVWARFAATSWLHEDITRASENTHSSLKTLVFSLV